LIGWGDESGSDSARDPGTYLLSVVLAVPDAAEQIQDAMRALLHKGTAKLHWRDAVPRRQQAIAAAVAALPVSGVVVVRSRPVADERPERRRRKCLEHLLPELGERGCSRLVLESRGSKDDARDRAMLDAMRRSRRLPHGLHLDHVPGPKDPALWAADALCGAVVADRTGENPSHLRTIEAGIPVDIITI